ncbi:MAG: flavodoxin-dependent (E)-4-hydroxy-3-methylbut-2-enyl-diphosphate synthase [Candidatus Aerophobetes bacterium]|nr:flavodoxin-dependent (E)-4-hydroxy-3-methylbut-2-enyl-diphosphate synthase [Candidatus Aerophobetes bacterium]
MKRRKSKLIKVGKVKIGAGNPIVVQGMTKTETENVSATVKQIHQLERARAKIVRVAIPTAKAAKAISQIKDKIEVPLVADIHFNYNLALEAIERGADKIRVNPGNLSKKEILSVAERAEKKGIPLRIGVNEGSIEKDLAQKIKARESSPQVIAQVMVESALKTVRLLENNGFLNIIISLKSHNVFTSIFSNQLMAEKTLYPLHLGVTAAGPPPQGLVKTSIGIGALLAQGIGDTIRVSLTADPIEEVRIAYEILRYLNLYNQTPLLISCPTCGRCKVDMISIVKDILSGIKDTKIPLRIAIMGCEVNGPGEAKRADIGVVCGKGQAVLFKRGKLIRKIKEKEVARVLLNYIRDY